MKHKVLKAQVLKAQVLCSTMCYVAPHTLTPNYLKRGLASLLALTAPTLTKRALGSKSPRLKELKAQRVSNSHFEKART